MCNAGYFGTGSDSCTLCTGSMTKPEPGDAATCDQDCDPESSRPNTDRTTCGGYPVILSDSIKRVHEFIAQVGFNVRY